MWSGSPAGTQARAAAGVALETTCSEGRPWPTLTSIDHAAVLADAGEIDDYAGEVEKARAVLALYMLAVEMHLAGAASAAPSVELTSAAHDVHGDRVTALGGLAQGLESVVSHFTEVDVLTAAQARQSWSGT